MATRVMVLGIPLPVYEKISPCLDEYEVTRQLKTANALTLLDSISYDLIIACYPLPDMPVQDFLLRLRAEDSPCDDASILLLAMPGKYLEAQFFLKKGVNRVISMEESIEVIRDGIVSLLRVAPRLTHRIMAWLRIETSSEGKPLFCQTENISLTGMLFHTDLEYAIGTPVFFKFMLPHDKKPISGEGFIARLARGGKDRMVGLAISFSSFEGDSQDRLRLFLSQKLT